MNHTEALVRTSNALNSVADAVGLIGKVQGSHLHDSMIAEYIDTAIGQLQCARLSLQRREASKP
ncbi:hypothetical protein [Silvimonas sp.]|uniref:hypothetical protein n=1 Tax=Silvimonas sp. TaxID=2650811 RepID=UPI002844D1DF|nr:hypothetical protein [Silvimonas sp.]MDR3427964.1 hypothetical protein [Silvimonas sp.]